STESGYFLPLFGMAVPSENQGCLTRFRTLTQWFYRRATTRPVRVALYWDDWIENGHKKPGSVILTEPGVLHSLMILAVFVERETGLEPATFCLEGRHSTN